MISRIYSGQITHARHVERSHRFTLKLFMLYLDLDELTEISKKISWFKLERWGLLSFCRKDYLAHIATPTLREAVQEVIQAQTGEHFDGPIRMLTQPRWFGLVMNPLTVYYCFDREDRVQFIIAEITNTPWGERYCYVLKSVQDSESIHKFVFPKSFHVSPFLPMNMDYTWHFLVPRACSEFSESRREELEKRSLPSVNEQLPATSNAESGNSEQALPKNRLTISIWNRVHDRLDFEAHLAMHGEALTAASLIKQWTRHPWMTAKILLGIYGHAAILYVIKRVTFYSHPKLAGAVHSQQRRDP